MTIEEFRESILEEIAFNASYEGTSEKEEFLKYTTNILIDADEIEDFNYVHFEGLGRRMKKLQIDGYSYSELDECLSIFICIDLSYGEGENLTMSEIERTFGRAKAFVEEASYVLETAEESSPGYGLAYDIEHKYRNIRKYKFYILSDRMMSERVKSVESDKVNEIEVNYNVWDLRRLFELYSSSTAKEDIVIDLKAFTENGIPSLLANSNGEYTSYLCNVPGRLLADIYNEYGSRLLEGNVRSFLQTKGKVNKGIRNTILNDPTMFFAYNNGIAGTASEVQTEAVDGMTYITSIKSLQIVNGGQTTASLAMALLKDKKDNSEEQISKVFVPMKLSVVSPERAQEMIPNISRYANSQNKVSDADLWSNHPFHIRLEKFSRTTIAPATEGRQYGTYWYYERANGQYRQETYKMTAANKRKFEEKYPSRQVFKKTDLAKYWNVMSQRPDRASKGGQSAFADFATYISQQWEKDETVFGKDFFQDIVSIAILWKESEKIVKKQPWFNSYRANIVAYTISLLFYKVATEQKRYSIALNKIWSNQGISSAWEKQIVSTSKVVYDMLTAPDRGVENVTEWAKRKECWDRAKGLNVKLSDSFINELQLKEYAENDKRTGKKEQQTMNNIEAQTFVYQYGVDNWKKLIVWNESHKALNSVELSFIQAAIKSGGIPSEKQCPKIIMVLNKAREEGYPG